jgi:DNA-binding MarR family transcriptional regulator
MRSSVVVEDVVRALGFLTLGSRMKRIAERLQTDTQRMMSSLDSRLQASQHPFLAALDRLGPLTIGDLAEAVGITQPGATRTVAHLIELNLVEAKQPDDDQRRRVISLTKSGQRLVDQAKREVWPRIQDAVMDLCADLSGPLLSQLDAIEDGLAKDPLERRAAPRKVPL